MLSVFFCRFLFSGNGSLRFEKIFLKFNFVTIWFFFIPMLKHEMQMHMFLISFIECPNIFLYFLHSIIYPKSDYFLGESILQNSSLHGLKLYTTNMQNTFHYSTMPKGWSQVSACGRKIKNCDYNRRTSKSLFFDWNDCDPIRTKSDNDSEEDGGDL